MGEIVFVRHGQASMGAADYDQLSDLGQTQASLLGRWWAEQDVRCDAVFTGPARRHVGTEANVAAAMRDLAVPWPKAEIIPAFDEHDGFGLVRSVVSRLSNDAEVVSLAAGLAAAKTAPERNAGFQRIFELSVRRWLEGNVELADVEPWPQFRDRVLDGLQEVRSACAGGRRVVVFSSVGPAAVLLGQALQVSDQRAFETAWRLRNTGVCRFVATADRFTLDSYNTRGHLSDPKTHTFR